MRPRSDWVRRGVSVALLLSLCYAVGQRGGALVSLSRAYEKRKLTVVSTQLRQTPPAHPGAGRETRVYVLLRNDTPSTYAEVDGVVTSILESSGTSTSTVLAGATPRLSPGQTSGIVLRTVSDRQLSLVSVRAEGKHWARVHAWDPPSLSVSVTRTRRKHSTTSTVTTTNSTGAPSKQVGVLVWLTRPGGGVVADGSVAVPPLEPGAVHTAKVVLNTSVAAAEPLVYLQEAP